MKKIMLFLCLFTSCAIFAQTLFINEFMADNDNTIEDPDEPGAFDDWIELYNAGTSAIDLGGMFLTDDLTDLAQWEIPAGISIDAGGFLLFWADNDEDQGEYHTNFKLSAGGEEIALVDPDGTTIIDSYVYDAQSLDVSEGRSPDGADNWIFMSDATPGSSNGTGNLPPNISNFSQNPLSPVFGQNVSVNIEVTDDMMVSTVYTIFDIGEGFQNLIMWDDGDHGDGDEEDGIYGCYIPSQASGINVNYYIQATDNEGDSTVFPPTAPDLTIEYIIDHETPALFVNEFMADNSTTICDPQGDFDDWIEIYNESAVPVDIGGMYITDNLSDTGDWWQIPSTQPDSTTIAPGSFLLLWADSDIDFGVLHLDIKLSGLGEQIGLFSFFGTTPVDTLSFDEQQTDISYGRFPDGSDNWIFMEEPTPGASNISMSAENDVLNDQGIAMKNYPNPFSEKTAIMFSISPELESEARINLYNIKGQFIRTYSGDQIVKSVNNQIFWDGRDSDNKLVADGLYLYKLTTSEGSISRKMILLH